MAKFLIILACVAAVSGIGIVPAGVSRTIVNQHVTAPLRPFVQAPLALDGLGLGGIGHYGYGGISNFGFGGIGHAGPGGIVHPQLPAHGHGVKTISQRHSHIVKEDGHGIQSHGVSQLVSVGHGHHDHSYHHLGWGHGHILPTKSVVAHSSHAYAVPAGYYGGLMTYPQVISTNVATSALKIPGHAVDAYRGYYGGYFPGTFGYGTSYRFFH